MGSSGSGGKRFMARYVRKQREEIEVEYAAADTTLSGSITALSGSAATDRLAMLADGRIEEIIMSTQSGDKYRIAINTEGTPYVEIVV
jgi:hypothetical protein